MCVSVFDSVDTDLDRFVRGKRARAVCVGAELHADQPVRIEQPERLGTYAEPLDAK